MEDTLRKDLVPGARVEVVQQIAYRDRSLMGKIVGTIVEYMQKPTGSWFAHAKNDKLWLDRLKLRRDDGEIIVLNLDVNSRIEVLSAPAPTVPAAT